MFISQWVIGAVVALLAAGIYISYVSMSSPKGRNRTNADVNKTATKYLFGSLVVATVSFGVGVLTTYSVAQAFITVRLEHTLTVLTVFGVSVALVGLFAVIKYAISRSY